MKKSNHCIRGLLTFFVHRSDSLDLRARGYDFILRACNSHFWLIFFKILYS